MKNTLLISAVALLLLAACQNDKTIRRLKPIKGLFFSMLQGWILR